jgi:hypothetical protein
MALFRRNKTWWTDFSVNGQRFRQSLDTIDWREALREEKKLIAQAGNRKALVVGTVICAARFHRGRRALPR